MDLAVDMEGNQLAACHCCSLIQVTVYADHHRQGSSVAGAGSHVLLLEAVAFSFRDLCRHMQDMPLWANAQGDDIRMADIEGRIAFEELVLLLPEEGAVRMPHRAGCQGEPLQEQLGQEQTRWTSWMRPAGKCSRFSTCHSWYICRLSCAYIRCSESAAIIR